MLSYIKVKIRLTYAFFIRHIITKFGGLLHNRKKDTAIKFIAKNIGLALHSLRNS